MNEVRGLLMTEKEIAARYYGDIWCDTTNTHCWMLYVGATRIAPEFTLSSFSCLHRVLHTVSPSF